MNLQLYVAGQYEVYYWALNALAALAASQTFKDVVALCAFIGALVTISRVSNMLLAGQAQKAIAFTLTSVFFLAFMFQCLTGGFNTKVTLQDSVSGNATVVDNVPVIAIFPQWLLSNIFTKMLAPQLEAVSQSTSATNGDLSVGGSGFLAPGATLLKAREALFRSGDPLNTLVNVAFAQCIPSDMSGKVQRDIANPFTGNYVSIAGEPYATALGVVAYYAMQSPNTYTGIGASVNLDTITPCSQMGADLQTAYNNFTSRSDLYRQFASDSFVEDRAMNSRHDYSTLYNTTTSLLGIAKNASADGAATTINMLTYSVIEQNANCVNTSGASKLACIEAVQQRLSREQGNMDAMAKASGSFAHASTFASLVTAFSIIISVVGFLVMICLGYSAFLPGMKALAHAILAPTLVASIANPVINGMMMYMLSVKFNGLANPNFVIDHAQIASLYISLSNFMGTASTLVGGAGALMALFFGFGLSAGATSVMNSISGSDNYNQKVTTPDWQNAQSLINQSTPAMGEIQMKGASSMPGGNTIGASYLANSQILPSVSQSAGRRSMSHSQTQELSQTLAADRAITNDFISRISSGHSQEAGLHVGSETRQGSGSTKSASQSLSVGTDTSNSLGVNNVNSLSNEKRVSADTSVSLGGGFGFGKPSSGGASPNTGESGGTSASGGASGRGFGAHADASLKGSVSASRNTTSSENASLSNGSSKRDFVQEARALNQATDEYEKSDAYQNLSQAQRQTYNEEKSRAHSAMERIARNESLRNSVSATRNLSNDMIGAEARFTAADYAGAAMNSPRVAQVVESKKGFFDFVDKYKNDPTEAHIPKAIEYAKEVARRSSYSGEAGNRDYDAAYQFALAQNIAGAGGLMGISAESYLQEAVQAMTGVAAPTSSAQTDLAGANATAAGKRVMDTTGAFYLKRENSGGIGSDNNQLGSPNNGVGGANPTQTSANTAKADAPLMAPKLPIQSMPYSTRYREYLAEQAAQANRASQGNNPVDVARSARHDAIAAQATDLDRAKANIVGKADAHIDQYKKEGIDDQSKSVAKEFWNNRDSEYSHKFKDGAQPLSPSDKKKPKGEN